jgi:DNA polymerase-3 subunit alpha
MAFTHLHVHSHYSFLTAVGKIDELLDRAKELGMTSLALTDYTGLYGAVEFYIHAKERGIKPIIGAEVYVTKDLLDRNNTSENRRRSTLVLLCENEKGYKNLMKMISVAHLEGFYYKARVDKNLLRKYSEGLIALSGSLTGEVPSEILYGNDARAKEAVLEYQDISEKIISFSKSSHSRRMRIRSSSIRDFRCSLRKRVFPSSPQSMSTT